MSDEIVFPILELTPWVFDNEKVFFGETFWDPVHYIKESELERHYTRTLVDASGNILNVSLNRIIERKKGLLPSIFPPSIVVDLNLKQTGRRISLDDLKKLVLARKDELFHITHNKLMAVDEFVRRVEDADNFEKLITIASFGLDDE